MIRFVREIDRDIGEKDWYGYVKNESFDSIGDCFDNLFNARGNCGVGYKLPKPY